MNVSYCHARTRIGHASDEGEGMTKADLVERVAEVGPRLTKKDCGLVVEAFLASVQDALARGEGIEIRGFGTFKVRHRKGPHGPQPPNRGAGRGSTP